MKTYHKNKEAKMLSRKKRIKQMNFQIQERRVEQLSPLSDDDKYIIEMSNYRKTRDNQVATNENILRFTGGSARPQYI